MSECKCSVKCSVCGKEWNYGGWESLYYLGLYKIPKLTEKNLICEECRKRIFDESDFCFIGYAPKFIIGASLKLVKCESKEELLRILRNDTFDRYICCIDDERRTIVDVCKNKKQRFVRGFVKENCIGDGDLPMWKDEVIKRYGSL